MMRKSLAVAALCLALSSPNIASAAPCASGSDVAALQVRMLQTELMVAALSCSQRAEYNAFAARFAPELKAQGKKLQGFFSREYGAAATRLLNSFITRIANQASQRSMAAGGGYCQTAAALYRNTNAIVPGALSRIAQRQEFAGLHGFSRCSEGVVAARPEAATSERSPRDGSAAP